MKEAPVYPVRHIGGEIDVNDFGCPLWEKAEPARWYLAGTDKPPASLTEAGLLWSDSCLYARYKAYDRDIFALHTERDSRTCEDDVLELFFKTDPKGEAYYNFEINALGAVYDAYQPRRSFAGGDHRWSRWNSEGLKAAVCVKGTLNDPSDEDEYWILQLALPFRDLEIPGKKAPEPGDIWLYLLARYDYSVYLPGDGLELSATSVIECEPVSYHASEYWNPMKFVK